VAIDVAVQRCIAKILRFTPREILRARLWQLHLMKVGQHFGRVHRKQPRANHGPEKSRRKRPNRPDFEPELCGAWLSGSLADRAGFEPAVAVTPRTLSKRVP
jgi:hypothetical protein